MPIIADRWKIASRFFQSGCTWRSTVSILMLRPPSAWLGSSRGEALFGECETT